MTKNQPQDDPEDKEDPKKGKNAGYPPHEKDFIQLGLETESVTLDRQVIREITNFSIKAMPNEAIGLLSGREIRPKELMISKGIFVTEGEEYSVSFSEEDFHFFDQVTGPEFCVGWWHSHPGFGLFLSQTDITTHIFSFQLVQPLSVALVVDPTDVGKDGIAKHKFFQVVGASRNDPFRYNEIASYLAISPE
ncbi:MAG: Mov34/MPN/PAD-1 family protein [Candidatus Hodarchaeales archaeon]|jgi:26S proteasome regulatory subunit N11